MKSSIFSIKIMQQISLCKPSIMASQATFTVNEIVGYKDSICIIEEIHMTNLGFNVYKLCDIENKKKYTAHKPDLKKATTVDLEFDEMDIVNETVVKNTNETVVKNTRFAELSDSAIDKIADSRVCKNTKIQTAWGVKIFRGKPQNKNG